MAKAKTPAQGKAQSAEADGPAETIAPAAAGMIEITTTFEDLSVPETSGAPTPEAEARPPVEAAPEPHPANPPELPPEAPIVDPRADTAASGVLEPDIVPDEMPDAQKRELFGRLTEFLSHFDRASREELSKLSTAKQDALGEMATQVHIALAQDRVLDAMQLAEKLGHAISAALIPDFDAELAAEGADEEANTPGVVGRFRVTRDGVIMQRGFPTTIRKGSIITSETYNMADVLGAVAKGRLQIEEI